MKKFNRMKRRFRLCCITFIMVALAVVPMSVKAEDNLLTYPLYHKHVAGCEATLYKTISADTTSLLRTVNTDICSCGGHHDYYDYTASCSCGRTWHSTGHACINSIAGSYRGDCGNYSWINCDTTHSHPYTGYICGMDESSVIDVITVSGSTLLPAREVTLTANTQGGLGSVKLVWDGTENLSQIMVSENGEYSLYATYVENAVEYISRLSVEIGNIDHILPTVSEITADKQEFTSENIILKVEAEDAGGLPEEYVSWNKGPYSNEPQTEIDDNGIYEVTVRDIAGNTVTKIIEITNIDKVAPEIVNIDVSPESWYSGTCTITVSAIDHGNSNDGSGLAEQAYSFDGGNTWTECNSIEISDSAVITIKVRDTVGNIAEDELEVERLPMPVVENNSNVGNVVLQPGNDIVVVPIEKEPKENDKSEPISDEVTEKEDVVAENTEKEEAELKYMFLPEPGENISDINTVQVDEEKIYGGPSVAEVQEVEHEVGNGPGKILIWTCIAGLMGMGIIAIVIYAFLFRCRIYENDKKGQKKYLGSARIRMGQKGYTVNIKETVIHKAASRNLKIKFSLWFIKIAANQPLKIVAGKCVAEKYVEKEIEFHMEH